MRQIKIDEVYEELGMSIAHVFKGINSSGVSQEDSALLIALYIEAVVNSIAADLEVVEATLTEKDADTIQKNIDFINRF